MSTVKKVALVSKICDGVEMLSHKSVINISKLKNIFDTARSMNSPTKISTTLKDDIIDRYVIHIRLQLTKIFDET